MPRDKDVTWTLPVSFPSKRKLQFRATSVRNTPTGVHAKLYVEQIDDGYENPAKLKYTVMNVDKHEDQVRLANAAYEMLKQVDQESYSKKEFQHSLSRFCDSIWPQYIKQMEPQMVEGQLGSVVEFLLQPYLIQGGGTILFAPPKRGKSYTGLLMAVSVDAGIDTYWPVKQTKVLYINLERSGSSIKSRLGAVNAVLGEDPKRPLAVLNVRGRTLFEVKDIVADFVDKYGVGLVILDSLSRTGKGMISADDVNSQMDVLNNVAPSWLALGHTPRDDEGHIYGGIMYDAAADVVVQLITEKKPHALGIGLKVISANDIPEAPIQCLAYDFDSSGIVTLYEPEYGEFPKLSLPEASSSNDSPYYLVKDYLLDEGKATVTQMERELRLNRRTVYDILKMPGFVRLAKSGKEQFYGVKD